MVGDTSRLAEEWQLWNLLPQPLCHRGVRLVPQGSTCTKQNTVVLRRKTKLPALSKHSVKTCQNKHQCTSCARTQTKN